MNKTWKADKDGTLWIDGHPLFIGEYAQQIADKHNLETAGGAQ